MELPVLLLFNNKQTHTENLAAYMNNSFPLLFIKQILLGCLVIQQQNKELAFLELMF